MDAGRKQPKRAFVVTAKPHVPVGSTGERAITGEPVRSLFVDAREDSLFRDTLPSCDECEGSTWDTPPWEYQPGEPCHRCNGEGWDMGALEASEPEPACR